MVFLTEKYKSKTDEWSTPDSVWIPINKEFRFNLDVCASSSNTKCKNYFSKSQNALNKEWKGICWMNPPYGFQLKDWVKKAYHESQNGATIVCLLPVRSNTSYWHDYCMKMEIRFIRGYPKFGNAKQGLKFPLAIVIFKSEEKQERLTEGEDGFFIGWSKVIKNM